MRTESLEVMIANFAKGLPRDVVEVSRQIAKKKQHRKRMIPFFQAVAELANTYQLLPARPFKRRVDAFLRLVDHAERLWEDSVRLLFAGSYSSSLFFSIVTIEELGKLAVAKVQAVAGVPPSCVVKGMGSRKSPLRSHTRKHQMAACAGAVINSRLDRVVGIDKVLDFLRHVENGELESERQRCLYYEFKGRQHLPHMMVSKERATLLAIIAGELLAEVGTVEPIEFERLLKKINEFETQIAKDQPAVELREKL